MAVSPYRVTPARIGNSSGLRLLAAFFRDHPQFAGAAGQLEVLDDNPLLLRLEPSQQEQSEAEDDSLMLGLFLDFLSRQALTVDQGPVFYTEAMALEDDELLRGMSPPLLRHGWEIAFQPQLFARQYAELFAD
jgi:antitoxin PrlF